MQEGFCLVLVELVADAGRNSGLFLILCGSVSFYVCASAFPTAGPPAWTECHREYPHTAWAEAGTSHSGLAP